MAFSRPLLWRHLTARLAAGILLVAMGAMMIIAWQMRHWATLFGALFCGGWILAVGCWSAVHDTAPDAASPTDIADENTFPLYSLLDAIPVALCRVEGAHAHAINRAARTLFGTDDRILPPPRALFDRAVGRLRHEGRTWRIDAVETAPDQRLAALIDVEAEERAAERRASDEMIDILGHELINGLSPIVSLADSAITAAARGDPTLPVILATLARRVDGLEGFTRAYRTLSRLPDPVRTQVALDDLADDLARLFANLFGDAVMLSMTVSRGQVAFVDRDQLTQAVWALLQNGAEAALAGSSFRRVELRIEMPNARLEIRVTDSGDGIAATNRTRIFRPFFTSKPNGSGIGLSLARRIARAHGGDLLLMTTTTTTFVLQAP